MDEEFVARQMASLAYRFRRSDEFTAAEVDAASYLRSVLPTKRYFPPAGGWALEYQAIAVIVDHILCSSSPVRILELGSGVSTVWLAHALSCSSAGGTIISLEQDIDYAERTRTMVDRYELSELSEVVHCPLTPTTVREEKRMWYDTAKVGPGPFDVLLVDGPFAGDDQRIRYPALPVLADRLADGAMVLADDTDRQGEAEIVRQWQEHFAGDRLRLIAKLRSSTFLQYRRI